MKQEQIEQWGPYGPPRLAERVGSCIMRGGFDTPYRYGLPISHFHGPFRILSEILKLREKVSREGFDFLLQHSDVEKDLDL